MTIAPLVFHCFYFFGETTGAFRSGKLHYKFSCIEPCNVYQ
uniref:Uncharacterized protein n=1 Tax=Anguilla anguilla TaxID=7936 RepID=A0A0E9UXG3_ANGAN